MSHWLILVAISLLLTLVIVGGFLLRRLKNPAEDSRILYLLMWLASLSILAYIAFAFGNR